MPSLDDPVAIGGVECRNRLYRAPLLECAGTGPEAVDRLIEDLLPAAQSGAGLLCQGATIVTAEGGCAAPNMTRVADPGFVARLERLTDAVHDAGAKIAVQLAHGGLRSMETWHAEYRSEHPDLRQLAVSRPPWQLRALDRIGAVSYDPDVLSTGDVYDLAAAFGRAAADCADAGYDMIHLAGANMGLVQQFLSPFYNRRDDEFGPVPGRPWAGGVRFLELVAEEIRDRAGDVPLMTKVPSERPAPPGVRRHLTDDDAVAVCERLDAAGYDAVVPVRTSVVWDMSIVRGEYPKRAWSDLGLADEYAAAFGGPARAWLVRALNRLESLWYDFEPAWNADLCRRVRDRVDAAVLCEGGIRERDRMDRLLGASPDGDRSGDGARSPGDGDRPPDGGGRPPDDGERSSDGGDGAPADGPPADGAAPAADLVGMARPFYAEPRLPARLLDGDPGTAAICESCNNCTVPQAAGEPGVCRTPSVLRRRGDLERADAYERED